MRTITLQEEVETRFPSTTFTDAECELMLRSTRFEFEPAGQYNGATHGLRSRGWIGHIPVGKDLLIAVTPKIPVSNLFGMLEVAYNLRSFRLFEGVAPVQTFDDIYERIVFVLCQQVLGRARRGLYHSYVDVRDELSYVRGTLDPFRAVVNFERGRPFVPCAFEEHTADLEDNQLLLFTLRRVSRQALKRNEVQNYLDRARKALAGAISYREFSAADCLRRFYHRLNHDYAPMHGLCRFILEQTGPSVEVGSYDFMPFELNMPRLFESFVANWLRDKASPRFAVSARYSSQIKASFVLKIEIDIVVRDRSSHKPVMALDTKYKLHERPSEDDLYQLAFYARELEVPVAALVYPTTAADHTWVHAKGVALHGLSFDLNRNLGEAGSDFLRAIGALCDRTSSTS